MALSWTLALKDSMSGAAKRAGSAVSALGGKLKGAANVDFGKTTAGLDGIAASANKAAKALGLAQDKNGRWRGKGGKFASAGELAAIGQAPSPGSMGKGVAGLGGALGMAGTAGAVAAGAAVAAAAAAAAVAAIGSAMFDLGVMIRDAQSFKQSTLFGLEQITKTKAGAKLAFDMASKTALDVGGDFRTNISSMNSLMAQGFDMTFADQLIRAMADLKTINPAANMQGIVTAISQIKTTGKLQGDELMQLAEAGLNVQKVYENIGKQMKLTAKNGKSVSEQVQDLQGKGKISSDVAISAIMASIKDQTGGQDFGAVAKEKADGSMDGMIARALIMKEQFLGAINIDWSPIMRAGEKLMAVMSGPAGDRLAESIGNGLSKVIALLDEVSIEDMEKGIDKAAKSFGLLADMIVGVVGAMQQLVSWGEQGIAWFEAFSVTIGNWVAGVVASVEAAVVSFQAFSFSDWISGIADSVSTEALALGGSIIDGIVAGVTAAAGAVAAAVSNACSSALQSAKSVLSISSPSKVFRDQVGVQIPRGMAQGINAETPEVGKSATRMGQSAFTAGQKISGSITNSRTNTANATLIQNGSGDENDTSAAIRALSDQIRTMNAAAA